MERKHSFFSLDLMNRVTTGLTVVVTLRMTKPHHAERDDYSNNPGRRRPVSRSGAILAAALVALFVVSLLGLALIQLVVIHHRQEQVEAQRQQCFWLAESGVQRALARLAKSPDYAGETWTIPSAALTGAPLAARPPVPLEHGQQAARGTRERQAAGGTREKQAAGGTGAPGGATVMIEVKAGQPGEGRKVHVEARFPDDPVRRIVCEREILINRSR
jgi:hypothetical protein